MSSIGRRGLSVGALKQAAACLGSRQNSTRSFASSRALFQTTASQRSAFDELEESSLDASLQDVHVQEFQEGQDRATRSKFRLPHSRYQYHPPRYDKGPLHPVQPLPSSDPRSRDFVPGPFNIPRLQHTWESTIAPDLMTMMYSHSPPGTPKPEAKKLLRYWDDSSPYHINRGPRAPQGVKRGRMLERDISWDHIPTITSVSVTAFHVGATVSRHHFWVIRAAIQSLTGIVPEFVKSRTHVGAWGLKEGRLCGATATMYGDRAKEFVDKCVHLVLPQIKEWPGVNGTSGDRFGTIAFGLTPEDVIYFPEIQAHQAMYPLKFIPGVDIFVTTTANSDRQARLLLRALGFPFCGPYSKGN